MAGETNEPDDAAARLEAALERIAAAAAVRQASAPAADPPAMAQTTEAPAAVAGDRRRTGDRRAA